MDSLNGYELDVTIPGGKTAHVKFLQVGYKIAVSAEWSAPPTERDNDILAAAVHQTVIELMPEMESLGPPAVMHAPDSKQMRADMRRFVGGGIG